MGLPCTESEHVLYVLSSTACSVEQTHSDVASNAHGQFRRADCDLENMSAGRRRTA